MLNDNTFAMLLRAERRRKGWSKRQTAKLAGMTEQNYGVIERGKRGVGLISLSKIAQAFGMKGSELLARWEARM